MRFVIALTLLTFFATRTVAEPACGQSFLDPALYTKINSHADLRQRITHDLPKYGTPDGTLSIICFAQHYSTLGDNKPFATNSAFRFGNAVPHDPLYHFGVLAWREQPGTDVKTSVAYWVTLASVDGSLVFVDDKGHVSGTLFSNPTLEPRTCSTSQFDPNQFKNVQSKTEIGRLIEQSILAYMDADGEVDWLCFAEAFMEMDEHLPEKLWATLNPKGANQRGSYRFTVRNIKLRDRMLPAPGGSNGEFTAIVHVENPKRIAIVERGGTYRWLEVK